MAQSSRGGGCGTSQHCREATSLNCLHVWQQLAAAFSVVALALCAVVFVVSSGAQVDGAEDSIDNILTPYVSSLGSTVRDVWGWIFVVADLGVNEQERQSLAVAAARETNLVMGAGQEGTDASAIKAAWATFKDSKDEEVLKDLSAWDPKEEEANVSVLFRTLKRASSWDIKDELTSGFAQVANAISDMKALGLETKV